mmetsp:Transcript_9115/g.19733  ORF Transcript_9115/g.19733 Transcript_9115/m.19733 type:complete len:215 (-) Transcript_9115:1332-1976(-)
MEIFYFIVDFSTVHRSCSWEEKEYVIQIMRTVNLDFVFVTHVHCHFAYFCWYPLSSVSTSPSSLPSITTTPETASALGFCALFMSSGVFLPIALFIAIWVDILGGSSLFCSLCFPVLIGCIVAGNFSIFIPCTVVSITGFIGIPFFGNSFLGGMIFFVSLNCTLTDLCDRSGFGSCQMPVRQGIRSRSRRSYRRDTSLYECLFCVSLFHRSKGD